MSKLRRFLLRSLEDHARNQSVQFGRLQNADADRDRISSASVVQAIRDDTRPVFRVGDETFGLRTAILVQHLLAVGGTGTGKTSAIYALLLAFVGAAAAARAGIRGNDEAPLGVELLAIDPKDDTPRLKALFAALYLTAPASVQRVLRGAFSSIEWHRDRVTPRPLLIRRLAVSVEYQAELDVEIIVVTGRAAWTDSTRFVLFQVIRLLFYRAFPFDALTIRIILTDEAFRLTLLDGLPADLADFFGRLTQIVAPQTIAAVIRRILIILSFPEVRAALSLPPTAVQLTRRAPIVLAACGPGGALPPEIAYAQAHALIVDDSLDAPTRDARIPKIQLVDELSTLGKHSPALVARYCENLRVVRAAGVAAWAATQSLDAIPASAVEEIHTNTGWLLALRSREQFATLLYPHLAGRSTMVADRDGRATFAHELESLPPQEGVLWVKSAGALRVRVLDLIDPSVATGIPHDELLGVFDEVLAPGSTMPIPTAERLLVEWRAAHLPRLDAKSSRKRGAPTSSLRDLLGLDGDES